MTPTVADVFTLLCLRPMGAFAHNLITVGKGPDKDILNGMPFNYNDFIKEMKGSTNSLVTYKEECCFYLFLICKFLAWTSSKRVINYYMPIARCLANDSSVDLSSFILGELYRAMFLLNTKPKQSYGGPVWLTQMWAYSYFPSIAPELHPTIILWSYGEAWMHARYPKEVLSYPTCFKLFSDASMRRSPEDFMPFKAKKYGSEDFQKFSSQGFFRGDSAWGACLQSRELVVIKSTNAGVEAYYPSLVARQFGLIQLLLVPLIWTKNKDWTSQVFISKNDDDAQQISVLAKERVTSFIFTPFQVRSMCSLSFHSWWETYMAHFNNEDDLIEAI